MKNNCLSVIIAAYNVGNYIEKCLESLIKQTYKNIEIIVVNDGSTDDTERRIREVIRESSVKNIRLINQQNKGLSSARNEGIKNSKGEYIAFVDGDDYVELDAYKKGMEKIINEGSEICIFSYNKVYMEKIEKKKLNIQLYQDEFLKKCLAKSDEGTIVAWNKIYRRDIIINNEIYFENRAYFEDTGFIFRYLFFVKKISIINEELYNYMQHNSSITKNINTMIIDSKNNTVNLIKKFYKLKNEYPKYSRLIKDMELRMDIYILNNMLKNSKNYNIEVSFKNIIQTKIPFRHRLALILLKLHIYKFLYKILK